LRYKCNNGCKSRLLFAEVAMAIWFEVSGVRCQEAFSVTIFYIFQDPPRPYIVFVKIILEQLFRSFKAPVAVLSD